MIICLLFAGYVGSLGDKSKRSVVEIKGRFSVTSENVDLAKVGFVLSIHFNRLCSRLSKITTRDTN
jgi:hypothetical protein